MSASTARTNQALLVMIVEDNHTDVYLVKEALRKAKMNFTALVFGDGESAIRYIRGEAEPQQRLMPDLAILDLNVPKRDGSEVLGQIRSHPELRHMAVVVLSSSPKHIMQNRAAEADCYITKPNELDEFLNIGEQIRDCLIVAADRSRICST